MRMREVREFSLPAYGRLELEPAGAHLMFVELKRPFKQGEKIPVTLKFERAGELKVELRVSRQAPAPEHRKH
jgi:hypothetical protein